MKPLNGKCAMTREEKNARRRELDADPFHHSLSRKTANAWREKHKDELNARKRAWYAANKDREQARVKAYREAHPDKRAASWKRWSSKPENVAKLRMRDRARAADPVQAERKRQLRRERMKDPRVRNRVRWQKRFYYHQHKHDTIGLMWKYKFIWLPKWKKIAAEGIERIERYRARCSVESWSYFVRWYRREFGIQLDPQKTRRQNDERRA